jgi:DNA polymerase-3 subunit alpha
MESLIKVGALDCLENRGTLLNSIGRILSLAQREQHLRTTGQSTMFDMFGEMAPVPLPQLDLTPAGASDREKAFWEKELTGVSFSEKPFSPVFSAKQGNAVFCGNIDAELDKHVVVTAGRVIAARYSFTRKNESFAIVTLEDVSGQIEVIAWPQVFSQTEELWKEGNELIVQGKVRARDDEVSVICDSVNYYEPPTGEEEANATRSETVAAAAPPAKIITPPPARRLLTIHIKQTDDAEGDISRLNKIIATLRTYNGHDEVHLNILNGGAAIPLRLPSIYTGYCPELRQQLIELIGEDGLNVEAIA